MARYLTVPVFIAALASCCVGQDPDNAPTIVFPHTLSEFGGGLNLQNLSKIAVPEPLAPTELRERLSDFKTPFQSLQEHLSKEDNSSPDVHPMSLSNTLLPGYADMPASFVYRNDEISKAAFLYSKVFNELNFARVVNLDELRSTSIPERLFPFQDDLADSKSVEDQFQKRIAQDFLVRAKLLRALGAFDLAEGDDRKAKQWGGKVPKDSLSRKISLRNESARTGAQADLQIIRDFINRGDIKEAFPRLARLVVQLPDDKAVLESMIVLLNHPQLHEVYFPDNSRPSGFREDEAARLGWDSLSCARVRLLIECHTRLLGAGDESHRRIRAEILQSLSLFNLSRLDTRQLVSAARPTAEDWLLHAQAVRATTTLENENEALAEAVKACDQALAIDPENFDAMLQKARLLTLWTRSSSFTRDRFERLETTNDVFDRLEELVETNTTEEALLLYTKGDFLKDQADHANLDAANSSRFDKGTDAYRLLLQSKELYSKCERTLQHSSAGIALLRNVQKKIAEIDQALSGSRFELPLAVPPATK